MDREKVKVFVPQSCPTVCNPMDCVCVTQQAPLSMELSGQEYWSELPFSFPGDLPDPGIEPTFVSCIAADSLLPEQPGK